MKYLCFDPGLKHTGVAISFEGKTISLQDTIISNTQPDLIKSLIRLITDEEPNCIVIGKPESGHLSDYAIDIKNNLQKHFPKIIIKLHQEDLTSEIAKQRLYQSKAKKTKRQKLIHSASAAIILEDYLENHSPS